MAGKQDKLATTMSSLLVKLLTRFMGQSSVLWNSG